MNQRGGILSPGRRGWLGALGIGLVGVGASIPLVYAMERFSGSWNQNASETRTGPPQPFAQYVSPGILRPPTSGVEGSGMRDEDEVIGVVMGGRPRAYRLDAMRDQTRHVVNDVVGGVPVSVAFCDLTDCVRAYTDSRKSEPLDFSVGGLYVVDGAQMVVKYDGNFYFHKSGKPIQPGKGLPALPCETFEPTRTTWKAWVAIHPDTDVYTGDRDADRR